MPKKNSDKKRDPNTSTSTTLPRIGDLLVEEGLITRSQLELALQEQQRQTAYRPLGQICLELNLISRHDLQSVLRRHQHGLYLGELLLNMGLLQQAELDHMLQLQKLEKKRLGQLLVEHQVITEYQLIQALSVQLNIPHVVPRRELMDSQLVSQLDLDEAQLLGYLPLHRSGHQLTVVMTDPRNDELLQQLHEDYEAEILPAIASQREILNIIEVFKQERQIPDTIQMVDVVHNTISGEAVLQFLLSSAMEVRANLVLIEPTEGFIRIRFRRYGVLQHQTDLPGDILNKLVQQICHLTGLKTGNSALSSGHCHLQVQDQELSLQVTLLDGASGQSLFLKLESEQRPLLSLERLGLNPHTLKQLQRCLDLPEGLMLVVGPEQAGKRTTLYAALDYLNDLDKSLFSIEEQILTTIPGIHQLQQPQDNSTTVYDELLKLQPDVLMQQRISARNLGPLLDLSRHGLQVLGGINSLHLDSLLAQVDSWGLSSTELVSTVKGLLFVRQIRTLCPDCKLETQPPENIKRRLRLKWNSEDSCYQPAGCDSCQFQGYTGVTGLFEFWEVDEITRGSLLHTQNSQMLRSAARQRMISLLDDGIFKALQGVTSLTEVMRLLPPQSGPQLKDRSTAEIYDMCKTRY